MLATSATGRYDIRIGATEYLLTDLVTTPLGILAATLVFRLLVR